MRSRRISQPHLEYRPTGFHWRRRWPRLRHDAGGSHPFEKPSLLFSLRTHVLPDAKALAQRLTLLSDIAFAGLKGWAMPIAPDIFERLLVELCRFLIESADLAREIAPARTPDVAAYELACANAATETLRQAIALRDRDIARQPLRDLAARLGVTLDEADPDWQRLAFRALRVMLDAQQENHRRDQGIFDGPSAACQAAMVLVDRGASDARLSVPTPCAAARPAIFPATDRPPSIAVDPVAAAAPAALPATAAQAAPEPSPAQPAGQPAASEIRPTLVTHEAPLKCPTISEATATYVDLRSKGYRSFKPTEQASIKVGESWARNSAPNVRSTGSLFTRILGDRPFDRVTDAELKAAWELVARLPRSYQSKTSRRSPQEAADEADETERHNAEVTRTRMQKKGESPGKIESELLKGRLPRLRTATIYRHMQDFQRICVFLEKKGYLARNLMADHIWESAEYERRETLEEDNERQTWCGRLEVLFRSPIFQDALEDNGDPMFWAPLIALHMGLRSEEILQLYVADIQVLDDIPCIVLRQGPGQSLKSLAARRTVPLHDNLLKLGFMQLVAQRQREGEPRLFPWIERSASKKTYTETFSKRFTRYRQDHRIYDAQRDFHSFRTTFNHKLIQAECQDSVRRALVGHVERDVGITSYNPNGFATTILRKNVNLVAIDISMIRPPFGQVVSAQVTDLSAHRVLTLA